MKYNVYLFAFSGKGQVREVELPPESDSLGLEGQHGLLEEIFRLGQNDFQPKPFRSVSVGDVIQLEGGYFSVENTGFKYVSEDDFQKMLQFCQQS